MKFYAIWLVALIVIPFVAAQTLQVYDTDLTLLDEQVVGAVGEVCISNTAEGVCSFNSDVGMFIAITYNDSDAVYTRYTCYELNSANRIVPRKTFTVPNSRCTTDISTGSVDGDLYSEVLSNNGLYDMDTGAVLKSFIYQANMSMLIDVNSDRVFDIITGHVGDSATPSVVAYISEPETGVTFLGPNLSISDITCEYYDGRVIMSFDTIFAENPDYLLFKGNLTLLGNVVQTESSNENSVIFNVETPGIYSGSLSVMDMYTGQEAIRYCPPVDVQGASVEFYEVGCTLGNDGDFNFQGVVDRNGWQLGNNLNRPATFAGKYAHFTRDGTTISHKLDCNYAIVDMTTEVRYEAADKGKTFVMALTGQDLNGNIVSIGSFYIYDDPADSATNVHMSTGSTLRGIASVDASEHHYRLRFNLVDQTYSMYLDGIFSGTEDFVNKDIQRITEVKVISLAGTYWVDYINVRPVTNLRVREFTDQQLKYLDASVFLRECENPTDRDFAAYKPGYKSYDHVNFYCSKLYDYNEIDDPFCGINELVEAIRFNPVCYWEAYEYCVDETYPRSESLRGRANAKADQGLDGATACSVALSSSVGVDRFGSTTLSGIKNWALSGGNPLIFGSLIAVLLMLAAMRAKRRS